MRWGFWVAMTVALVGCSHAAEAGAKASPVRLAAVDGPDALAFKPLSADQLAFMKAARTTTARNPAIPSPLEDAPAHELWLGDHRFNPHTATAAEAGVSPDMQAAMAGSLLAPMVKAWAPDAKLVRDYVYAPTSYYDGKVPATWVESEHTILNVFGWPLAYHSAAKQEYCLVYVKQGRMMVVRIRPGDRLL